MTHPISEEQKRKIKCRGLTKTLISRGEIERVWRCQKCNAHSPQIHHPDYNDHLNIMWLCRRCHLAEHGLVAGLEAPMRHTEA